ncbi:MAG: PAS domain S-box protein [Candidatus Bathyarchaeia archaeon]|jgi:PAS domain S-box-containing protein
MTRGNALSIKILHIENDPNFAQATKKLLESKHNFEIENASSIKDANEKLEKTQYDVLVLDLELPDQDGLSFLEEITRTNKELPFVLFTEKNREQVVIKTLNLGASGYVNKHGDQETVYGELAHCIIQAVEKKRQKRLAQTLLDTLPCVALLLKPYTREIVASNKAAFKVGATPGETCYSTWGKRKKPCEWCLAPKLWTSNEPQHLEVEDKGTVWDIYWVPIEKDLYLHYVFDVTEIRVKEKKLRESESKLRTIADYMYDWEYWTSPKAQLLFVSPSSERLTGYSAEEFINNPKLLYEIVHPDDKPSLKNHFTKITQEPTHIRDFRIITRNGETRWLSHACQPVYDEKGNFLGRRISNRDITDRKKAEQALFESEKRWEATLSSIGDAVIATDTSANITFINKTAEDATGWSLKEVKGKPLLQMFDIVNEKTGLPVENPVKKVLEKGVVVGLANHTILKRKDHTTVPIDDSGAPIKDKDGKITGAVLVFRDISERKKTQEALEASEKRFHQLFTSMTEQFQLFELVYNEEGYPVDYRLLEVNPAFEQLVGKTREQLIGKQVIKDLWPVEQYWLNIFDQVLKTGKAKRYENYGEAFGKHYDLYIYKVNDTQLASIATDITERKKAEQEIADLARFPQENPNPVLRIAMDGTVLFHNKAAQVFVDNPADAKTCKVLPNIIRNAKTVLAAKRKKNIEIAVGKQVFMFTFAPIIDAGYTNVYGLDVTEKKKMETKLESYSKKLEKLVKERSSQLDVAQQQLLKAERLAAIGELAGMIGHDLRNPLTGIKTSIYYLKKNNIAGSGLQAKEMVEIIEKCIDHSNKIINDLLEYSREIQLQPQPNTPKTLISETIAMMKTPAGIAIINQVCDQGCINVDSDKMKRVFSNLIKNAIEAMPNGGQIRIDCSQTEGFCEFKVADNGPGIPPHVMQKIFSPLITTKAQGMGFGLAICKRIVEAHGGVISVETGAGGTIFMVKVPTKL